MSFLWRSTSLNVCKRLREDLSFLRLILNIGTLGVSWCKGFRFQLGLRFAPLSPGCIATFIRKRTYAGWNFKGSGSPDLFRLACGPSVHWRYHSSDLTVQPFFIAQLRKSSWNCSLLIDSFFFLNGSLSRFFFLNGFLLKSLFTVSLLKFFFTVFPLNFSLWIFLNKLTLFFIKILFPSNFILEVRLKKFELAFKLKYHLQ